MKLKKLSVTAVVAVLAAMSVATTVFATGAPAQDNQAKSGYKYDHFQAVEAEVTVMVNGETGERFFSVDGSEHWMTEDRYHAEYGDWGDNWTVEWWGYDEYKDWLEEEKEVLQSIIGERGYTSAEGWFVWDQKRVDEAIARYEEILENIRNGALYSKAVYSKDGSVVEDVALGSDEPFNMVIASAFDTSELVKFEHDELRRKKSNITALLTDCVPFGLTGEEWSGLFYNGQRVRCFVDGVPVEDNGYGIQYTYYDVNGTVDVHTLHAFTYNPDGSYDPFGKLIGLASAGDAVFDSDLIRCADPYDAAQTATAVEGKAFFEPKGDSWESGTALMEASSQDSGNGKTLVEILAQYEPFGLTYAPREDGRLGRLFYNGQPVKYFADLKPDGFAFTCEDPFVEDGAEVHTVYDENGALIGLTVTPSVM